tara:strand:+ start:550 stop:699 length:150 start_codon:yes stop_codon:yes gene_type:complete
VNKGMVMPVRKRQQIDDVIGPSNFLLKWALSAAIASDIWSGFGVGIGVE